MKNILFWCPQEVQVPHWRQQGSLSAWSLLWSVCWPLRHICNYVHTKHHHWKYTDLYCKLWICLWNVAHQLSIEITAIPGTTLVNHHNSCQFNIYWFNVHCSLLHWFHNRRYVHILLTWTAKWVGGVKAVQICYPEILFYYVFALSIFPCQLLCTVNIWEILWLKANTMCMPCGENQLEKITSPWLYSSDHLSM